MTKRILQRMFFNLVFISVLLLSTLGLIRPSQAAERPPAKVDARLWQATANNGLSDVLITAAGYPDLSSARNLVGKEAKTQFVVNTLIAFANTAQASLRADLQSQNKAFFVLWASNQIALKAASRADLLAVEGEDLEIGPP
ncbi:MAG: hypothetical protein HC853_14635 [Anaerolineae bacterium]|nr:hypothetical protein [Anaerolineae bacterium]